MKLLTAIVMAFAMFSRVPTVSVNWNKENMQYMLGVFPLVGLVLGLLLLFWLWLADVLHLNDILFAAGITLLPVLFTGGVHMDGFLDTVDALSSHADAARKREILKDPHTGAFAIIYACVYVLGYFALATALPRTMEGVCRMGLVHVLSRTCCGLIGLYYPIYSADGLLSAFRTSAARTGATVLLLAFLMGGAVCLWLLSRQAALAVLAVFAMCAAYLFQMSRKQFGGMSGDLAGYFLQLAELCALAVLILSQGGSAI